MENDILKALQLSRQKRNALSPLSQDAIDMTEIMAHQFRNHRQSVADVQAENRTLKDRLDKLTEFNKKLHSRLTAHDPE